MNIFSRMKERIDERENLKKCVTRIEQDIELCHPKIERKDSSIQLCIDECACEEKILTLILTELDSGKACSIDLDRSKAAELVSRVKEFVEFCDLTQPNG